MTEPILVVDFGTWATSAAVVIDQRIALLLDPATGSARWPSAAFLDGETLLVGTAAQRGREHLPRNYVDGIRHTIDAGEPVWLGERQVGGGELISAYLDTLITESERVHGVRIERLALTVPAGYRPGDARREPFIAAATAAGFPDVELVSAPVAAVLDERLGADLADGSLVLVCDLGATWTVALLRMSGTHAVQLFEDASRGGLDLDLMLINDLRVALHDWIEPMLTASGDAAPRLYYAAADLIRRLKHQLDDAEEVVDRLTPAAPPYHLDRSALERFAEPGLRWLLGTARAVVARAGESLADVDAVVLIGGNSRLAAARTMMRDGLGRRMPHPPDPELAVIRGAARWAAGLTGRQLSSARVRWRIEPLSWDLPDDGGRLVRWLVDEGQAYPAGALLAQVRTADDRVYDLTATRKGVLLEQRVPPGDALRSGAVAATIRVDTAMSGGSPVKRYELRVAGQWLLTPERDLLVEATDNGGYVKVRTIANGAVVNELRPDYEAAPRWGRVFRDPAGQLTQVACDADGRFFVWDLRSGRKLASFREAAGPVTVLVDEARWRLVAEAGKKAQIGRYRRDVATVWDLATGDRIEELVGEDLHRHYSGYADRGATDGFATEAYSPDRRLRAVTAQSPDRAIVSVHEVETGQDLFSVDRAVADRVRVAFDAQGRHLIANWRAADTGWVDVWEL